MSKVIGKVLLISALVAGSMMPGWAQRTTATLAGIVTDTTSAVLPGAEVALLNENTGAVLKQLTSEIGEFVFTAVPADTYTKPETIPFQRRVPSIIFPGMISHSPELLDRGHSPTYSLEQQFGLVRGHHTLKFGGLVIRQAGGRQNGVSPRPTFQTLQDLQANRLTQISVQFTSNEFVPSLASLRRTKGARTIQLQLRLSF